MATEDFNWDDTESVVVQPVEAIAVYRNPKGDVVIRQRGDLNDDDKFIVIPVDRVPDVITALKREADLPA